MTWIDPLHSFTLLTYSVNKVVWIQNYSHQAYNWNGSGDYRFTIVVILEIFSIWRGEEKRINLNK